MRAAHETVELHDSEVLGLERVHGAVLLLLDLYLHRTEGPLGSSRGTGWGQQARLSVGQGVVRTEPAGGSLCITDGFVQVGEARFDNLLPLPFAHPGPVLLRFTGAEGVLEVKGQDVSLTLLGEARFIERGP